MADPAPQASISRVAIRVPPFWPADPALWFAQLEGQFLINGIVRDDTKYGYVIGNLEAKYASEVKDIIIAPPETDKYDRLKQELIARLSATQEQKTRQLLEREELGDRKPSQFLRCLRDLGGDTISETLLRTLWITRLPNHVQAILATQAESTLDAVACLADKVLEISPQAHIPVATVSKPVDVSNELFRRIDELQQQIAELKRPSRSRFNQNTTKSPRTRSPSSGSPSSTRVCWYHRTFGDKARRCTRPCEYPAGNVAGSH